MVACTTPMAIHNVILTLSILMVLLMGVDASSSPFIMQRLKLCQRRYHTPIEQHQCSRNTKIMDPIVLQIRGGGIWGGRGKQQQSNSAQDNDNEEEYEYEYEYEYYNEDGSVEEGDEISSDDDNEVEYEYYEEEDEKDSLPTPHGEVHGDVQDDIVQDLDSDVDKTDVTQEVEASAEDEQSKVQIGEPKTFLVVDTEPKTILVVDEVEEDTEEEC